MHKIAIAETLRRGRMLAAAIDAENPDNFAWVGVYPLDLASHLTVEFLSRHGLCAPFAGTTAYHIRTFEVCKSLINDEISVAEAEMVNRHSYFAFGESELHERLRTLRIPIGDLDLPHKSNYPI